jgi:hypothetical protein
VTQEGSSAPATATTDFPPENVKIVRDDQGNEYVPRDEFEALRSNVATLRSKVDDFEKSQSQAISVSKPEPDPELEEQETQDDEAAEIDPIVDEAAATTHGQSTGEGLAPEGQEPERFIHLH